MTYFPQNPISPPNRFGTSPPRNPREAADAIMAYLDREAAGAAMPRTPFAPFLAETYEAPVVGGEGYDPPASIPSVAPYIPEPFGAEDEEEPASALPFPEAQTDDERIENVLWLLERKPVDPFTADGNEADELSELEQAELSELLKSYQIAGKGKAALVVFQFLAMSASLLRKHVRQARAEMLAQRRKTLEHLEPNNPLLQTIDPSRAPRLSDLERLEREIAGATNRAFERGVKPSLRLGENDDTIGGRGVHRLYSEKARLENAEAEVSVKSGRIDRVDIDPKKGTAIAKELKPNNPRAIARGKRQGQKNASAFEAENNKPTTSSVEVYEKPSMRKWLWGGRKK